MSRLEICFNFFNNIGDLSWSIYFK